MMRFAPVPSLFCALTLLAACTDSGAPYPQLLPMAQLTTEPAVPAHASDAIADPGSVQSELSARAAAARAAAPPPNRIGPDAGLEERARALRARADQLRQTTPGSADDASSPACDPDTQNCPSP
ncbi:MAG: hypothetical protein DI498_06525 [Paracoccus denitrificans]|nr:MAG: hypothetical protein DI498_06525 [Paracoccus denitrificans]PZO84740.1 MAG: hypothetical protein DI633_06525 [Paracoccus denitrificans]